MLTRCLLDQAMSGTIGVVVTATTGAMTNVVKKLSDKERVRIFSLSPPPVILVVVVVVLVVMLLLLLLLDVLLISPVLLLLLLLLPFSSSSSHLSSHSPTPRAQVHTISQMQAVFVGRSVCLILEPGGCTAFVAIPTATF